MSDAEIRLTINTDEVTRELDRKIAIALEEVGLTAERYAKRACPVDTGRLRNSITHAVKHGAEENAVYLGTNVKYAPWVELGHRQKPGRYVPAIGKRLKASHVAGKPFLKPAVVDHVNEYKRIIESAIKSP